MGQPPKTTTASQNSVLNRVALWGAYTREGRKANEVVVVAGGSG
jgi:hypothetical protein